MRSEAAVALWLMAVPAWAAHPCAKDEAASAPGPVVLAGIVAPDGTSLEAPPDAIVHAVAKRDRYGRLPAFAFDADHDQDQDWAASVQERWLRAGRAVALPPAEPAACRKALLAAEAEARGEKRGVWRRDMIERAVDRSLGERTDRFAIVEGRILSVGDRERVLYLNFGANWTDDFTVILNRRDFRRHPEMLRILGSARGRTVRVRGWLERSGGPFMRVRDVGQIELDPD